MLGLNRRSFIFRSAGLAAGAVAASALDLRVASAAPTTYTPTWASVDQHPPAPEWFQDAKFGIYFHWGAFSVPAFQDEWYPRWMYYSGNPANQHHINTYGDPSAWPYHNFINGANNRAGQFVKFAPRLKSAGGNFDPNEWAQLFADAGAKFAGPVAEHHDGYSMWDSQVNNYNSVTRGPGLNLLAIFRDAFRAKNMKLLVAMHHAFNHTGFYDRVPAQSDPNLRKLYGQLPNAEQQQLWYDKLKEVIDRSSPDILWQDFNLNQISEQHRLNFLAYYYNHANAAGKEVVATYKIHDPGSFNTLGEVTDYERGGPADIVTPYWLTDDAISSSSWCYTQGIGYYTTQQMLHALIDRVSKNGNMLLNVSPIADGTIPQGQRTVLAGIGDYLRRFGASIYSTRHWTVYGEGPTKMGGGAFTAPLIGNGRDIRFTRTKDNRTLYATVLAWPGSTLNITTLAAGRINLSTLASVRLLASAAGTFTNLPTRTQDVNGLRITMPASAPFAASAYVVRLDFSGPIPALGTFVGGQVFTDVAYTGVGVTLAVGTYSSAALRALGIPDRSISSIQLPPGYSIVGYSGDNLTGTAWTFNAANADLRNTGNNDAILSLKVIFTPSTWFHLNNVTSGLALDSGGQVPVGSNLKQWTWDTSPNLQWQAIDLGTGYYRLVNRTNGMSADSYGATANGAPARQATWNGGVNQQWTIVDRGQGRYSVICRGGGLALDGGGATTNGSQTKLWSYDGSTNLLWNFVI